MVSFSTISRLLVAASLSFHVVSSGDATHRLRRRQETTETSSDVAVVAAVTTPASTSESPLSTTSTVSDEPSPLICLILKVHVQMSTGEEEHLECDLISQEDGAMIHGLQIELPEAVVDDNHKALHRGEWFVRIHGGARVEETLIEGYGTLKTAVLVPKNAIIETLTPEEGDVYIEALGGNGGRSSRHLLDHHLSDDERRVVANGKSLKLMVVRVRVSNKAPTYSVAQLKQYFFDTNSYSFTRQYALCSSGYLWFHGFRPNNPVVDVFVSGYAGTFTKETLWKAALTNLQSQLGVASVTTLANHVAFILPAGLKGGVWYGTGTVGSWRSIFSDTYGGIPNTVAHEIGHNFGMGHAGLGGDQYGDETDLMGYGSFSQFGPTKCFNGVHTWSLGWFTDKTVTVNPFSATKFYMLSFADYGKTTLGKVVVKVGDFYLIYNRASGVNAGTGAVPDTVTISQLHSGEYSTRVGAISPSTGPFQVGNWGGGSASLIIDACSVTQSNGVPVMLISIGVGVSKC